MIDRVIALAGTADLLTLEMAAVTIRPEEGSGKASTIRGCAFDIPGTELASYFEREHRYLPVQVLIMDGKVVCFSYDGLEEFACLETRV